MASARTPISNDGSNDKPGQAKSRAIGLRLIDYGIKAHEGKTYALNEQDGNFVDENGRKIRRDNLVHDGYKYLQTRVIEGYNNLVDLTILAMQVHDKKLEVSKFTGVDGKEVAFGVPALKAYQTHLNHLSEKLIKMVDSVSNQPKFTMAAPESKIFSGLKKPKVMTKKLYEFVASIWKTLSTGPIEDSYIYLGITTNGLAAQVIRKKWASTDGVAFEHDKRFIYPTVLKRFFPEAFAAGGYLEKKVTTVHAVLDEKITKLAAKIANLEAQQDAKHDRRDAVVAKENAKRGKDAKLLTNKVNKAEKSKSINDKKDKLANLRQIRASIKNAELLPSISILSIVGQNLTKKENPGNEQDFHNFANASKLVNEIDEYFEQLKNGLKDGSMTMDQVVLDNVNYRYRVDIDNEVQKLGA